ncbi:MAG: transporter [Cyclobacteriaceae bacterium]|nr:transporter [Cyclobacteriaceae bacterium]
MLQFKFWGKIGRLLFALIIMLPSVLLAQGTIGTERPTTSTSSYTISKNSFQFEQGFAFWNDTTVLDGLFRLAVSERGEIRLFTSYGSNTTYVGAKVNLWKQNNYKPGISIQASFGNQFDLVNYRVSWSQKLTEKLGTTFNVGKANIYYVVLALGYSLGDKASLFVEAVYDDKVQQFNAGLTYLINGETQVDFSGGLLTNDSYFVALGVSRRFLYKSVIN